MRRVVGDVVVRNDKFRELELECGHTTYRVNNGPYSVPITVRCKQCPQR